MNAPALEDQLVSELWAWDVRFLMGRQFSSMPMLTPASLIASLAQSENARVRLSLIPLFLRHPEFASEVKRVDKSLSLQIHQLVLRFYYTAAFLLQRKYWERLVNIFGNQPQLPELFSTKLGISLDEDPEKALLQLANRHQILTGQFINWLGTYEHAAERLVKHMEKFK